MGEVPALVEPHADHRVARLYERGVRGEVGARPRVGLHVRVGTPKQGACPLAGQILHDVDLLAAAVVPPSGIPLGVLVGEHAPHRLHDGGRREVLRCDELDGAALPLELGGDG